ncbi:hypothetical protein AHAS_Ahas11G0127900 [Arachis hypogaea]
METKILQCDFFLLASKEPSSPTRWSIVLFYEIWNKIKDYFYKSTKHKVKQVKIQLKLIKKHGLSAAKYISKIKLIVDSLYALGSPLSTKKHINIFFEGLDEDYQILFIMINSKLESFSLCKGRNSSPCT